MPVTASREHIISLHVDAVVNPATPPLTAGEGVSTEIFAAAGQRKLTAACRRIGYCETGHSAVTKGYDLPAKYVIHAVGPIWHGGQRGEREQLISCYRTSLELARPLRTPKAGNDESDAAFLLLEDAAQKGNAEAMFLVGQFYDPQSKLPRGSIPADMSQAKHWYDNARSKGYAEADKALAALRRHVEGEAAKGNAEASLLLREWK